MKLQFFSILANDPEEGQQKLNAFLAGHRIASIEKNFVIDGVGSFWAICVSYLEQNNNTPALRKSKVDYRVTIFYERECLNQEWIFGNDN